MAEHSPAPWQWVSTPSAHSLDYPANAPDEVWDGAESEDLTFDKLCAADGTTVLDGVWCNDTTAEIGVRSAADARLIASTASLADEVERLRTVEQAARAFVEHHLKGQPKTPGTLYPMTYAVLDQWHADWDSRLETLRSALAKDPSSASE